MKNFVFILLLPFFLNGQENNSVISLKSSAIISVPADIIYFTIDLSSEHSDPGKAFDAHKILEKKLLTLISEYNIPDSSIQYSLMNIRKLNRQKDEEILFETSQRVRLSLTNLEKYYEFQIALFRNGFSEFRAAFASSLASKAENDGYRLALENAKNEAEQIADALGQKVGKIIEISTSIRDSQKYSGSQAISVPSLSSLMEIEQKVSISTNIEVKFELVSK